MDGGRLDSLEAVGEKSFFVMSWDNNGSLDASCCGSVGKEARSE